MRDAVRASGGDTDAANHIEEWVTTCGAFEDVSYRDFWSPVVPGDDDRYEDSVYAKMMDVIPVSISRSAWIVYLHIAQSSRHSWPQENHYSSETESQRKSLTDLSRTHFESYIIPTFRSSRACNACTQLSAVTSF